MAKNKKRKKKPSPHAVQQLSMAKHKNEVMEDLDFLCFLIGGTGLFDLIPKKYRDVIYDTRGILQVVSGDQKKIQKRLAVVMAKELREEMSDHAIEVVKGRTYRMSLDKFLMVGVPLYLLLNDERCLFRGKERFECFYKDNHNMKELLINELEKLVPLYCDFYSDLKRRIMYDFWIRVKLHYFRPEEKVTCRFTLQIVIEPIELEPKQFKINNEMHLGTPVIYIERRPKFKPKREEGAYVLTYKIAIAHKYLDPKTSFPNLPINVYIQQHAVERLMERTCCPFPHWIHGYLIDAMEKKPNVIRLTEDRFLIEYRMVGIKIGYFLATLVDGELLLRTFLFITHNGTPEGQKLEKATGLQQEDRKYLSMDNIRTLANSDIEQNETMHKLFLQSGLGSLLELCKRVREKDKDFNWLISDSENKTSLSRLIIEYMKPDADNDEFVEVQES
ncbi:MAG: hypothetical protein LBJ67_17835 [Planctomycetaceae bacterium]|jgi:hypothetical protein|nr:hypothetical protein [Planctomycetaceae bacterium]